ncbi:DNA-processing protein DprA [Peribacillus loiseleuriae]|uniref:DNA-processing protein DprA n=1 Tax=Peribacillus loiseleuriae TaxID=1679170 RepID=UPI003CFCB9AA
MKKILLADPSLTTLYTQSYTHWKNILPISATKLQTFYHDLHHLNIQELIQQYKNNDIEIVTIVDDDYPNLLKQIHDPPWVLYLRGDRRLLTFEYSLGVVGARKPSEYGVAALKRVLPPLVKKNYVIISGVATGIDAAAHRIAIDCQGKTIGILGGGHYHMYPVSNIPLATNIIKYGLLISETPPSRRPEPWMFPVRNRIISGLSKGVFVVEARARSGSLITAKLALEQGREVFAIPGNITSELSAGSNFLIQEGAKMVLSAADIDVEIVY